MLQAPRVMVIWCPDWPIVAAVTELELPVTAPVAVIDHGEVYACSQAARADGVRRGMRRRDASARCPELVTVGHNPARDLTTFESVLGLIEQTSSTVMPIRPGLCALNAPARYFGGEHRGAAVIAEILVTAGIWDCRIGVADEIFTAEQAARLATAQDSLIIPADGSAPFLAGLPIGALVGQGLGDTELVSLLERLGIRTLAEFTALSHRDVLTRFGERGSWLHRLARGSDRRVAASRRPPLELAQQVSFEPPLTTIEPIAFSSRQTADRCIDELTRHGLVCSELRIVVRGEDGWIGSRVWAHPRWFSPSDLVDRLYWQLQGSPAPEPVVEVRFVPEAVESTGSHGEGLWGSTSNERIDLGVARLQGMLGPEAVLTATVHGGRSPGGRQALTPWGQLEPGSTRGGTATLPWPGSIPPPAPSRVFRSPHPVVLLSADGAPVRITERGGLSATPARLRPADDHGRGGCTGSTLVIDAWAGPWPIDELWWDPCAARQVARCQLVAVDGSAWLVVAEGDRWWVEASYE